MTAIEILTTPLFWILSAVVSVVLSIVANLATPIVSRSLARVSATRKRALEEQIKKRRAEMLRCFVDPNARTNAKLDAIYWLLRATVGVAVSLLIIVALPHVPLLGAFLLIVVFFVASVAFVRSLQWVTKAREIVRPAFLADARARALAAFRGSRGNPDATSEADFLASWDEEHLDRPPKWR